MKRTASFWERVFYLSILILVLWLILKLAGVIQTPAWLELGVPVGSAIFGILSLYKDLSERISRIAVGLARIESRVEHMDKDIETLKVSKSYKNKGK